MRFELTSYFKKIRITYANLPQPVALPTELSGHIYRNLFGISGVANHQFVLLRFLFSR